MMPESRPQRNFFGSWEISFTKFYSLVIRTLSLRFWTRILMKNLA